MKLFRKVIIGLGIGTALVLGGVTALSVLPGTGWKAMSVQTGSMSPDIPTGSLVLVHRVPTSSLKIGDVITYTSMQKKGKTVTHRITQKYRADGRVPGFVTKGDANKVADVPIVAGQVKGKVIFSVPYAGTMSKLLMSWPVIIALIYLPSLLVIIEELKRLTAYYKTLMPYKAAIILAREKELEMSARSKFQITAVPIISLLLLVGSVFFALPVQAMFKTNSVALVNSNIKVKKLPSGGGGGSCNGSNTNNVNVNTSTNQTSTTGNVNNSNNTNTGNSTSGNASNSSSTNINITITNC